MKKIMIISSTKTGHGHQSIAAALTEQIKEYSDIQVDVVDGFLFLGRLGLKASGIYGPVTRYSQQFWKLNWEMTANTNEAWVQIMASSLNDRFMQRLKNDPPNLIVSVHPMFNACITSIIREYDFHIPFITLLADLVDIHPMWVDNHANCILCPTDESMKACKNLGAPGSLLHRCDFPTRRNFTDAARKVNRQPYSGDRSLECLLMSGGEGSGNLKVIAEHLLNNFNTNVTVICGRNLRMKALLEKQLTQFGNRINILGFCTNVQDYMMKADVTVMRGSPNSMMEAVVCNTPLIITGSLPGQEASNPEYAQKHGLGVICLDLKKLPVLLQSLLDNNAAGLNNIMEKQRIFRNLDSASEIARLLVERTLETPPIIPDFEYRFPLMMQTVELFRKLEADAVKSNVRRKKKK